MKRLEVIETVLFEFEKKELLNGKFNVHKFKNFLFIYKNSEVSQAFVKFIAKESGLNKISLIDGISQSVDPYGNKFESKIDILKFDSEADEATFLLFYNDNIFDHNEDKFATIYSIEVK